MPDARASIHVHQTAPAAKLCIPCRCEGRRCLLDGQLPRPHKAPRSYHSVEFRQQNSGPQLHQGKFGLRSGTIIGPGYIAVCDDQIAPIVLLGVTFLLSLASLWVHGLFVDFPLHHFKGLAPMEADQITGTPQLRIRVKAIAHSTMSHDLGNVGLMLTTETLLTNAKAFASLGKSTGH